MDKKPKTPIAFLSLLYIGFIPFAPGTFGSLFSTLIFYITNYTISNFSISQQLATQTVIFASIYIISVKLIKKHSPKNNIDQQWIVIDELLGIQITLLPLIFLPTINWLHFALGFLLFRIFDILKPLGIKRIDYLHNAHSVILDDVLAGIYATIPLSLILLS